MKKTMLIAAAVATLAVVTFAGAFGPTRITIRKSGTTVNGQVNGFTEKPYVFRYTSGKLIRVEVTSRNDCVKLGSGDTSTNLVTVSGDNYFDVRNSCGLVLPFKVTLRPQ